MAHWVGSVGYIGLFIIVFLEMGIFFALPGDSLVLTAGLLAIQGIFNIWVLVAVFVAAAILGFLFGYWFGDKLGHWILKKEKSFWFKKEYIQKAHDFFEKHGGKALIIARFVPIVRTFTPIVAGMGKMNYRRFVIFNIVGAFLWGVGVTLAGYFLGELIPNISKVFLPLMMCVILLSLLPGIIHFYKERQNKVE